MQCGTMSCHDAGVVLGLVIPLVLCVLVAEIAICKLLDALDKALERKRRR